MRVVLVATYELGHQSFGLSSPKAWLTQAGHEVSCSDLTVGKLDEIAVANADFVAFHLTMHTATRLAVPVIERVQQINPSAKLACYGLYAPLNRDLLESLGVRTVVGGEFEQALVDWASRGTATVRERTDEHILEQPRLNFLTPNREGLPNLDSYAHLRQNGTVKTSGYTEASRGCKHLCRHCPVVPVYQGQFRIVQRDIVLNDIRQQVAVGARHITFGDPDFFNGPTHAMKIVESLHAEFPEVTYDATIKIEHLKKHRDLLRPLKDTGCLFVTSAVESIDDAVLAKLEKHHTRADFFEVAESMREAELNLQPTFIAFMPWTTPAGYTALLRALVDLDLVENTAPVQLALRLLVTQGSRLLDLQEIQDVIRPFDPKSLVYPWSHPDPNVDALSAGVFRLVGQMQQQNKSRAEIFSAIWQLTTGSPPPALPPHRPVPHLDEPWYCCAEPAPQV